MDGLVKLSSAVYRRSCRTGSRGEMETRSATCPSGQPPSVSKRAEICLPDDYEPLPNQVAGHFFQNGSLGLLRRRGDKSSVLKPLQRAPKGPRELKFYQYVFSASSSGRSEAELLQMWVPRYSGLVDINLSVGSEERPHPFLVLEDLSSQFAHASTADVKIGKRSYDNEATEDKIRSQIQKYPLQEEQGFRLSGMRVYNRVADEFHLYKKDYGYSLDGRGILVAFRKFFSDGEMFREDIVAAVLKELKSLLEFFQRQDIVHFYSSSLLITYDSAPANSVPAARVKMIDFAHTYILSPEDRGLDENYIYGLTKFITAIDSIVEV